ncbi:hypothetical protein DFJ58DRAFT_808959, partial [Suillus subalutaceus]|uniref:uncharacterized protein n=1 Tax=Suillus subalutaceus TaxID=48586 RepID=UPI001B8791BC
MIFLRPVVFSVLLTSLTLALCLFCCWMLSHHVILPLLACLHHSYSFCHCLLVASQLPVLACLTPRLSTLLLFFCRYLLVAACARLSHSSPVHIAPVLLLLSSLPASHCRAGSIIIILYRICRSQVEAFVSV